MLKNDSFSAFQKGTPNNELAQGNHVEFLAWFCLALENNLSHNFWI